MLTSEKKDQLLSFLKLRDWVHSNDCLTWYMLLDFAEILVDVWMSGKDARNGLQLHRKTCEIFEPPLLPNIIEYHRSLQILDCPKVRRLRVKTQMPSKFNQS